MDRDAWIMAASLLDRHGVEALSVVSRQLEVLTRAVQMLRGADDMEMLMFWRQTAQAMLAIVEKEPAGPHSVN
jgi:hypothetical protein